MGRVDNRSAAGTPQDTAAELSHVLWIGGSPCAGKSMISRLLASKNGLKLYETDLLESRPAASSQSMKRHMQTLNQDQLWLRPPAEQVATELDYCREELALAVAELRELPTTAGILVEGTALLPQGVVPLLTRPRQAVWLVPTPEFQRHHYPARGEWAREVVAATSDPTRAFDLWMERDVRYGRIVAAMAREMDQLVIEVDGSRTAAQHCVEVAEHLGLVAF